MLGDAGANPEFYSAVQRSVAAAEDDTGRRAGAEGPFFGRRGSADKEYRYTIK